MDKSRKFDFESNVRVPEMDEIVKIASDFSEPESHKTTANLKEALAKNTKVAPKLNSEMSLMRQKMRKLAVEIAEEESSEEKSTTGTPEPESVDAVKGEQPDLIATEDTEKIAEPEKEAPKKKAVSKASESGKRASSSDKKSKS